MLGGPGACSPVKILIKMVRSGGSVNVSASSEGSGESAHCAGSTEPSS